MPVMDVTVVTVSGCFRCTVVGPFDARVRLSLHKLAMKIVTVERAMIMAVAIAVVPSVACMCWQLQM